MITDGVPTSTTRRTSSSSHSACDCVLEMDVNRLGLARHVHTDTAAAAATAAAGLPYYLYYLPYYYYYYLT